MMEQEGEERLPGAIDLSWLEDMGSSAQNEGLALESSSAVTARKPERECGRWIDVLVGVDGYYILITSFAQ